MKKVLFVFGTRPEAIKLAPVIKAFKKESCFFLSKVCVTAQHRELLDQVLNIFDITPDWDLHIMKEDQNLFDVTTSVILRMENVLSEFKPDLVFVQGDTTSSFASALAAFYKQIPVAHIEAGLRTNNIYSPWPEEMNRQIISRISAFHFAPTEESSQNLLKEGIPVEKILITGNTIIDSLNIALNRIKERKPVIPGFPGEEISQGDKLIIVTSHRRENFGKGLESICRAVVRLADKYPDVHFIYPVHFNPNIRKTVNNFLIADKRKNVHLIKPLEYLPFIALMERASVIVTDSGGIQEEAPCLGKPVLVTRKVTERPEGLASGIIKIVGTDEELIVSETTKLLEDFRYYRKRSKKANLYGDGKASLRILNFIKDHFLAIS